MVRHAGAGISFSRRALGLFGADAVPAAMPLPRTFRLKDGGNVVIRSARAEDAEAHIENWNAIGGERVYLMTERFDRPVEEIRKQFREADPVAELWLVAERDGKVVGGANFLRGKWVKSAHTASLGVALRPEHRGLGIGQALVEAGLEWARSVGVRKLKLGVFATNTRAIALYRRLGFEEEGRLKAEAILDGVPVDELLMARWL
jgi:RimJ/RimL family protein N-acetyltransferase